MLPGQTAESPDGATAILDFKRKARGPPAGPAIVSLESCAQECGWSCSVERNQFTLGFPAQSAAHPTARYVDKNANMWLDLPNKFHCAQPNLWQDLMLKALFYFQ